MVLRITDNTEIRTLIYKEYRLHDSKVFWAIFWESVHRCRAGVWRWAGSGNSLLKSLLPVVLEILINRQGGSGGGLANVLGGMLGGGGGNAAAGRLW